MLPPFVIDTVAGFHILRDDLIEGGTKRRALNIMLSRMNEQNIVYSGTVMGHGALALAHAAKDTGKSAHIFIASGDPDHASIEKLRGANAIIHLLPPQPISSLYQEALNWQGSQYDAITLPPAFDTPQFADALGVALNHFDASSYPEIWTTCVSGTLTRAFQRAFPDKAFKTVKVAKAECDLGISTVFQAPEKYHHSAKLPPPYPSCTHTDAKLWQFAREKAAAGALIWNTAG